MADYNVAMKAEQGTLSGKARRYLLREAHHVRPTAMIGKHRLTANVINAVNGELEAHELIKVKFQDFKEEKKEIAEELARATSAKLVGVIGNIAIYFRPAADEERRKIFLPQE